MKTKISVLALTALVAGCQVAPGSYTVVRIASADTVQSPSCWDNNVPAEVTNSSTSFYSGGTLGIFAADAETYFLDSSDGMGGSASIEGTREGGDYSFYGETIDYDSNADGMDGVRTITTQVDVKLTLKTHSVIGTTTVTTTCTGVNCGIASCVETTDFVGTVVRDVELEHGI